ncbi:NAD(P)-binding domain-containing protein [Phycisphaera mikurensis]|uniref:Putative oxidoreductase n=1 Tax=Phycisphaera mikurensis (strain NBRC 102666 / KCTC 22515 / FYK2301M01) TaxID=1142394 RepID=I0IJ82_PHYMF|nr:NAD(P)-binding domain-containing protein [Phycisphaera mikurensis]MBB6443292.1 thioredoxin reductase (NADPH) [Phycisphaera mikurensis]BAM05320.1 putative oxidoreductase [Phycisphaera mikurensis NBRC 102666]
MQDLLIVGAGPIGIELAAALTRSGLSVGHVEAGALAQTVVDYPKRTRYFSSPDRIAIAGVPLVTFNNEKALREEYLAYLRGVVTRYDLPIAYGVRVEAIRPVPEADGGGFRVETSAGVREAKRVVLAIGDMHGFRRIGCPGEDLPHVSHRLDEPHLHFRRRLLIVGGKNSAAEAALRCHHAGAEVTLSYRQAAFDEDAIKYWVLPELKALIRHRKIHFLPNTEVASLHEGHAVLRSNVQDQQTRVRADSVLLLTGYVQDKTLFETAGVRLEGENHAPALDKDTMETNVPGLYVAGTAAAGTQNAFQLFIENCHRHVEKIVRHVTGEPVAEGVVNQAAQTYGLAES